MLSMQQADYNKHLDKEYLNYFDYNTLICLFCMLTVIAGLKDTNINHKLNYFV